MKLVDSDAADPELPPPPPRPRLDKRRVSVSFLLTMAVLVGTVATIFLVFPERHNQLVTSAVEAHHAGGPWDLDAPDAKTLRAWTTAAVGRNPPLPAPGDDLIAIGARTTSILHRPAAVIRFQLGPDQLTFVIQRARDVQRRRVRRVEETLAVEAWRKGPWTCVVIGPAASFEAWRERIGAP
jgi:hypothetical protein